MAKNLNMSEVYHIPAMLEETIRDLDIKPEGTYVDVTFGGGGHSRAIMSRLGDKGRLFSFDQDMDAYINERTPSNSPFKGGECRCSEYPSLKEGSGEVHRLSEDKRWQFVHGNFRYLRNFMDYYGVTEIDGLLADLGVSFHHFDEAERGFSFRFAGPLDMRMNREGGRTAADIVNTYSEEDLTRVFRIYGEMSNAKAVAQRIVKQRENTPIIRTEQLTALLTLPQAPSKRGMSALSAASEGNSLRMSPLGEVEVPTWAKKDLARMFQALRIEVNDELGALREMLLAARELLRPGGRIAILTYHSLEDRIVKNFLRSGNLDGTIEKDFYGNILTPFRVIEKGATASEKEVERNPRARSAKLRVAEKL